MSGADASASAVAQSALLALALTDATTASQAAVGEALNRAVAALAALQARIAAAERSAAGAPGRLRAALAEERALEAELARSRAAVAALRPAEGAGGAGGESDDGRRARGAALASAVRELEERYAALEAGAGAGAAWTATGMAACEAQLGGAAQGFPDTKAGAALVALLAEKT